MAWSELDTLSTISFNDPAGDTLFVDPLASIGLFDQAPARTPYFRKAATDGARVFPFPKDARPITIGGVVLIRSASSEAGYVTARDALIAATIAVLDGMLTTPQNLDWGAASISCYSLGGATFPGAFQKRFVIPLLAPDPDPV